MATQTELQLIISAQNKATAELNKLSSDLKNVQGNATSSGLSLGKMIGWLGGVSAAYAIVKNGIIGSVEAWEKQEQANAQTNAVLISTKGIAGMTAKSVNDLAERISYMSTMDDVAIQSAENMLLTFTHIGKDIFPQATQAVVDMSIALGQDLKNTSIQVGKALQDPILGVTALRRVGVAFNQTQRDTLKQLVETGHGMEAQKIILNELATEFGGSATAKLNTFGGKMEWAKNRIEDLQKGLGAGLVNSLTVSISSTSNFFNEIQKLSSELTIVQKNLRDAFSSGNIKNIESAKTAVTKAQDEINKKTEEMRVSIQETQIKWADFASWFIIGGEFIIKEVINIGKSLSDLSIIMLSGGIAALFPGFLDKTGKDIAAISEQQQISVDELAKSFEQNRVQIEGLGKDIGGVIPPTKDFGDAASGMASKLQEAQKKIKDLKDEMKKAVASAKEDIQNLKDDFKKQEVNAQKDLGKSIADVIVGKQKDLKDAQIEYNKATTIEEKKTAQDKIMTIKEFLNDHLTDQQKYATQILAAQQYAQMDEIQQLIFTFAEEKKQRQTDYDDQIKDLKKHLKDVEKEYKDKLKDLKSELQKELGNIVLTVTVDKQTSKKKALGGSVSSGTPYLVGEYRPEIFVPSQSGNIRQTDQVGGGREVTINFNNPIVRQDSDIDEIIKRVEKVLNKKQEFYQIGAY